MKLTFLRMTLVAGVLLAAVQRLPAQDKKAIAEAKAMLREVQALQKAGKRAEAIKLQEKLLEKVKADFGPTSLTAAGQMNSLAAMYEDMGEYAKAEPLYLRCLEVREAKLGKNHLDVATALNHLGAIYGNLGDHAKAEPLYRRCLEVREAKLGKNDPAVARVVNNLAVLYYNLGQHAKAEPLFRRSLEIREAKLGKDHPDVATAVNNLAALYDEMGQYAKAEPLYRRSLEIREAKLGKDHPDVATAVNNLAILYYNLGQYAKAEPLFRRSLEIREARLGKDHPLVALSLNNLAALYQDMRQYAKAEPLYRRSLEIREARLGKDHPDVAQSLSNLAVLYDDMGQYGIAEPLHRRSLEIREARLGKDHPDVALSLNNLASLCQAMGQYTRAEPLYRRCLEIREAKLGKNHPDLVASLNNLATLYAGKGELGKALPLLDRARRGSRLHLAAVLPALSDADKASFFRNTTARAGLEAALSLSLAQRSDAAVAAQSAAWLLNGKAVDQESLASSVLLAAQSSDPVLGSLATRLLAIRQQLARLSFAAAPPGQEKQRLGQIDELTAREQELARKLRQAGSRAALSEWVEPAELRRHLPADAVLIDVAHFRFWDVKAKPGKEWQAARCAAWLTAKTGAVRLIDLGPADRIDAAVKQFREAIQASRRHIREQGEEKAEKMLREHLDVLASLVLKPLLPHIEGSKRWLISPDGNLWLLPWEALTLPDGSYAIEKHPISYLTSGRDLLPAAAGAVKAQAPVVLADPDFDLEAARARAEGRRLLGKSPGEEATRALSGAFRLGAVRRLPATASEAAAITPSLKAYTGATPRLFTGEQALEGVVKAARSPRLLVLSTHGFFLPDQEVLHGEKSREAKPAKRWENPLLRCGLLLAGCNNAAAASQGEDGVLTGLEVVGLDLRGTELVVLSACETGLGDVQAGEGVSGLRQAFQLAGAQAVVSTLWQVPDKQSARLMALFFANLSKGQGKAEALRAAKLKLIEERRDDYAAAHPFFWAAFTLTGQP
jgi:CHAT domain-containing protein/Tfp pilus assembly protein PilF